MKRILGVARPYAEITSSFSRKPMLLGKDDVVSAGVALPHLMERTGRMASVEPETFELTSEMATVYRVRIAHTHTLKDGWRVSETTVEATGIEINYDEMRMHMKAAYEAGTLETSYRNRLERDYNRGVMGPIPKPANIGTPEMGS